MAEHFDIAIIGAGIAGASLAAELAANPDDSRSVLMLEAESMPGYHATGRSAAFWEECYGGPEIVPLTAASGAYLRDGGFLKQRGALYIGRREDTPALDAFMERFADSGAYLERIGRTKLEPMLPGLKPAWNSAIWQPDCADIDVAALHAHYLTIAKRGGAALLTNSRLMAADWTGSAWSLRLADGAQISADILVNASGAWADEVAIMAGVQPLCITPLRRTVAQLRTDPSPRADQPLVLDISGKFYFKPESGRVWLSPHDEEASPPCDAAPEEIAVASAIDALTSVMDWHVEAVERKWAGLRSFAPDRLPVYGFDSAAQNFFWFAGQGGYGIQTAPAAAAIAAGLLNDNSYAQIRMDGRARGIDAAIYSPARFG